MTLLATKLHRPISHRQPIHRPDLNRRLSAGLQAGHPVFLISAPAGFGKTTCLCQWLESLEGWPAAWFSLEPADDDPGRFFAYLIAALQSINPRLGGQIEAVLRAGQLPPAAVISAILVDDILAWGQPFLLVFDDFQVIQDAFILEVLDTLVTSPPPGTHLAFSTREDPLLPLARLRANDQLTEIRARDLRFSLEETGRFMATVMGLSLSHTEVAALGDKTEGWPAGLQLAGLSMQEHHDPAAFIAALSGSHHFILSYLTEQVLERQPPEVQDFLLQTSILERMNAGLCQALTGRSDSLALLAALDHANIFLAPLDEAGEWYRYHPLFRDLTLSLQQVRYPEQTNELHRRASRWYAQAGIPGEAIQHALAGADYPAARDLLEAHALVYIMRGHAKTVSGWVGALPDSWVARGPKTHLAFAWMYLFQGAYGQAASHLAQVERFFSGRDGDIDQRQALEAEWLVMQALLRYRENKLADSLQCADAALAMVPTTDDRVRSLIFYTQACVHQALDAYQPALQAYTRAIQHGRAAGNTLTEMLSTSGLAQMAFERGQLHLAFEITDPVCQRQQESGALAPISTVVFGLLGEIHYQWGQLEPARRFMQDALQLSTLGGYHSGMVNCRVLLSRLALLEGDLETATGEIQAALDGMRPETPDYVRQEIVAQQARCYLARNRPAAAMMVLEGLGFSFRGGFSYPDLPTYPKLPYSLVVLYNAALRTLLYQAGDRPDHPGLQAGRNLVDRLVMATLPTGYTLTALESLLVRAQLCTQMGDHAATQEDYRQALALGEPGGFVAVFIEAGPLAAQALGEMLAPLPPASTRAAYLQRILAAFPISQPTGLSPSAPAGSAEPFESLTDRELQVLRRMARGLKYQEIAAELYLSVNTVRYHVKGLYRKLNANRRIQAVEVARRQGIL